MCVQSWLSQSPKPGQHELGRLTTAINRRESCRLDNGKPTRGRAGRCPAETTPRMRLTSWAAGNERPDLNQLVQSFAQKRTRGSRPSELYGGEHLATRLEREREVRYTIASAPAHMRQRARQLHNAPSTCYCFLVLTGFRQLHKPLTTNQTHTEHKPVDIRHSNTHTTSGHRRQARTFWQTNPS